MFDKCACLICLLQKFQNGAIAFQYEKEKQKSKGKPKRPTSRILPEFDMTRDKLKAATERYDNLHANCNQMLGKLQQAKEQHRDYKDSLQKMLTWLGDAEHQMEQIKAVEVSGAPGEIQSELDTVKAFNMESISYGKNLDELKRISKGIGDKMRDLGADEESLGDISSSVEEVGGRLKTILTTSTSKSNELQTALVESQGIYEGLDSLLKWVKDAETALNKMKPISLSQDSLDNQIQELHMLQSDIESHTPSVDKVNKAAKDLIKSGSDPNKLRDINKKLSSLNEGFKKVAAQCTERGQDIDGVSEKLAQFNEAVQNFEEWVAPALDTLQSSDTSQLETPAFKDKIKEIDEESRQKTDELEKINKLGKALVQNPKTADVGAVKGKVAQCGKTWQEFEQLLRDREREAEYREKQASQYELLRDEVLQWLNEIDNIVDNLQPVAIDVEVVEKQIEELKVGIVCDRAK